MRCHEWVEEIAVPSGWRERLEELAGRRRETALVAGLVVVVTILSLVAWGRSAPATVAPPSSSVTPGSSVTAETASTAVVHVHVAGAVAAPGLYTLPEGARVADAIAAAGGARRRAMLDLLNLAQMLADGMKVDVPRRGDEVAGSVDLSGGSSAAGDPLVNINSADQQALEAVPGLGPVKAGAIVRHREEAGPFTALEQVMEVSGIGPATFEQIRPFISL